MMAVNSFMPLKTERQMLSVEQPTERLLPSPPQELFEIEASKTTVIVTQKGSRLTFPAFGWHTPEGRSINGLVQLTITELSSPAEIIAAGLGTTTQDRLLEMPVMLHIEAFSAKVGLNTVLPIEWELPVESYKGMNMLSQQLFHAASPSLCVYGSSPVYDWQLAKAPKSVFRTLYRKQHLLFQLSAAGWWGIGTPVKCRKNRKMVSLKTTGQIPALTEQKAFIVFELHNSIIRMHEGAHHFTSFHVPGCHKATVVSFGITDNELYGGKAELDPKACITHLNMKAVHYEELSRQL